MELTKAEQDTRDALAEGSFNLLKALWQQHSRIMHTLGATKLYDSAAEIIRQQDQTRLR